MNFLTADVAIKVDDKQLSSQLSKAKTAVSRTVDKIKTSFSKMAASFKAAFDKMVKIAKWGALAIAGVLTLASRAAMKQEDAIFGLVAALKVAGEYTPQVVKRLIDFAAAMQQVTIFGDEATIEQMAYASALGVSADKMEASMKAAMGLAVITKSLETATMLVARAAGGQTQMLTRYGIMLDETLSPQEKFNALLEKGAELFDMAKAKAETTSGALKQMWNVIGDVSEVIGAALLPGIKETATAIKDWAIDNTAIISYWSTVIVAYMAYIKDIMWDFVVFLNKDWHAGVKFATDLAAKSFNVLAENAKSIFTNLADELYDIICVVIIKRIVQGFENVNQAIIAALGKLDKAIKEAVMGKTPLILTIPTVQETVALGRREKREEEAAALIAAAQNMQRILTKGATETREAWMSIVPPELADQFDAAGEKLAASIAQANEKLRTAKYVADEFVEVLFKGAPTAAEETIDALEEVLDVTSEIGRAWEVIPQTMVEGFTFAAAQIKDQMETIGERTRNFVFAFEYETARGLENTLRNYENWKEHLLKMFQEIYWAAIRIAIIEPAAAGLAGVFAGAAGGVLGGGMFGGGGMAKAGTVTPQAGATLAKYQGGGTIRETGPAFMHKGEEVIPANQSKQPIQVNVNYIGQEKHEISVEESAGALRQTILTVTMEAMQTEPKYRRSIKQAARV